MCRRDAAVTGRCGFLSVPAPRLLDAGGGLCRRGIRARLRRGNRLLSARTGSGLSLRARRGCLRRTSGRALLWRRPASAVAARTTLGAIAPPRLRKSGRALRPARSATRPAAALGCRAPARQHRAGGPDRLARPRRWRGPGGGGPANRVARSGSYGAGAGAGRCSGAGADATDERAVRRARSGLRHAPRAAAATDAIA